MMKLSVILFFLSRILISGADQSQLEYLSGKKMMTDNKSKWDQVFSKPSFVYGKSPAHFLSSNFDYIPYGGSVLDLGMGEGRNAVFLAQKGYKVTGIDLSSIAVKKSQMLAKERGVSIKAITANVQEYNFPENSFDAIVCFYFVDRALVEKFKKWLKPKGVIIYEAYSLDQKQHGASIGEPDHEYLKNGELLKIFSDYRILKFEEPLHKTEFTSSIIVQKK